MAFLKRRRDLREPSITHATWRHGGERFGKESEKVSEFLTGRFLSGCTRWRKSFPNASDYLGWARSRWRNSRAHSRGDPAALLRGRALAPDDWIRRWIQFSRGAESAGRIETDGEGEEQFCPVTSGKVGFRARFRGEASLFRCLSLTARFLAAAARAENYAHRAAQRSRLSIPRDSQLSGATFDESRIFPVSTFHRRRMLALARGVRRLHRDSLSAKELVLLARKR